jgi:hypothetical protein
MAAIMQCAEAVWRTFTAAVIPTTPELSHTTYFTHNFQNIITA